MRLIPCALDCRVYSSVRFFPSILPFTFHCLSVCWVPIFSGAWELMAGLSGFASHECSLHLGAGCQQWKLQDVLGT